MATSDIPEPPFRGPSLVTSALRGLRQLSLTEPVPSNDPAVIADAMSTTDDPVIRVSLFYRLLDLERTVRLSSVYQAMSLVDFDQLVRPNDQGLLTTYLAAGGNAYTTIARTKFVFLLSHAKPFDLVTALAATDSVYCFTAIIIVLAKQRYMLTADEVNTLVINAAMEDVSPVLPLLKLDEVTERQFNTLLQSGIVYGQPNFANELAGLLPGFEPNEDEVFAAVFTSLPDERDDAKWMLTQYVTGAVGRTIRYNAWEMAARDHEQGWLIPTIEGIEDPSRF